VSEALGNLAGSVADLGADGKNDLETAVLLETLGVDDETARRYGFADVFGLAAALSPEIECRNAHPELTVAMPAFNTERYIGEALRSVLDQEGVDFEVIVVDDGSTDGTARVVSSLADPRVRLVHNPVNRGIGWCHQHVLELSRAPFITHVDSDDLLVPGALRAILAFARLHPRAAQVHAFHFAVDEDGRANRNQWRLRRREFLSRRRGMDYRAALMELGTVNNGLRTYRKALLHLAGGFDPRLSGSEDLEAGLRIVERFEIRGLPQFLYVIRHHSRRTSPPSRAQGLVYWWRTAVIVTRLTLGGAIRYPLWRRYRFKLARRLGKSLPGAQVPGRVAWAARRLRDRSRERLRLALRRLYRGLARCVGPAAAALTSSRRRSTLGPGPVVYFLWRFPSQSQTFIQREVRALRAAGLDVQVAAETRDPSSALGREALDLVRGTRFLDPPPRSALTSLFKQRPLRVASACLGVFGTVYEGEKSSEEDLAILGRAVALAQLVEESGAHVVHSPWADRSALVARAAARMAGVAYTVQARAHDLYRGPSLPVLRDNLRAARHIVTNAEYNRQRIRSLLPKRGGPDVRVVYEGLDVAGFEPHTPRRKAVPLRLLCVARLIEEKGLVHLLDACRRLSDRGLDFECRIVGGPEAPGYTNYRIRLLRLHGSLGLGAKVVFMGALPFEEVRPLYGWADLFLLPCVTAENGGRDITPNVILEAMASGLPVVSTRNGAIPELVRDEEGVLVEPGDSVALAAAIEELAVDPERRGRLGGNARRAAESRFDISRNVRVYLDLLTSGTTRA
jgi:glycosyltransferase involved in cell wall biosynthesis